MIKIFLNGLITSVIMMLMILVSVGIPVALILWLTPITLTQLTQVLGLLGLGVIMIRQYYD